MGWGKDGRPDRKKQLNDRQWKRIEPPVAGRPGDPGRAGKDSRLFIEAVLWIARTGSPWRDLPRSYGRWNSVYRRFRRWAQKGVFKRVFHELASETDGMDIQIDGTIMRVHQHAAGVQGEAEAQAVGKSRGGRTTKMTALVDADGKLVRFSVMPGHRHDLLAAMPILKDLDFKALIADKAYDSDALRTDLETRGAEAVIPPKSSRIKDIHFDHVRYARRHLVENFFCKLKHFRRIATRYEQTAASYCGMICMVSSFLALA